MLVSINKSRTFPLGGKRLQVENRQPTPIYQGIGTLVNVALVSHLNTAQEIIEVSHFGADKVVLI